MIFQEEKFETYLEEAIPMMIENGDEVNFFNEKLNLDFEAYEEMEKDGSVISYTVRDDSKLVGYCLLFIYNHLHHMHLKVASQDVIYIDPKYRTCGIKLLRYTEKELKKIGVKRIIQAAPKISRLGPLLERMGYEELETLYTRKL